MEWRPRPYRLTDAVGVSFCLAPLQTLCLALKYACNALLPSATVLITAAFLDGALKAVGEGLPLSSLTGPMIGLGIITGWRVLSEGLFNFAVVALTNRLRTGLRLAFAVKRGRLAYEHVERQESWDLVSRVSEKPEEKWRTMLTDTLDLIASFLSAIGVLALLVSQVWWAGLLLLVTSIPLGLFAIHGGRESYEADREVTKISRMYKYLGKVLSGRESVEERSLFGYTDPLNHIWRAHFEKARLIKHKADKKAYIRMKAGGITVAIMGLVIMFVLLRPVMDGAMTVGMFIALVVAVCEMASMMSWRVGYQLSNLAKNREYMKDLTAFAGLLEQADALCSPEPMELKSLEFRNVCFTYPGAEQPILNGLSFLIREGEHVAFVGANGAGKTTLTKLILGLYEPDSGEILLNGQPISTYAMPQRKGLCAVVFQDFARYQISLGENLLLGNKDANQEQLWKAIALAGLSELCDRLLRGQETLLGKLKEGGQDLSGGEWQRVAMARALVNPAPLRILDEPTAALDPVSESRLYHQFKKMSTGHTTIFISHRLGSTQLANRIYVLSCGRVVEEGSHGALMKANGIYALMFESQRSWYE